MKYVQVSKALYDYEARTEDELSIRQDDVLYVIDKEDQDWWKAELKQVTGEEQGPIGLVPAEYMQEVTPIGRVRAEYDYAAQQEEELSFEEGEEMDLLETDDPDWYLVKLANGQIGLAPSNYVDPIEQTEPHSAIPAAAAAPVPAINPLNIVSTPQVSMPPSPQVQPILAQQTGGTPREVIADDAQSWSVHEYDAAKKKKKKGKGNLYIGNGMLCYGSETDKALPVQQYPILDVTKYLFDGKNLHIEVDGSKNAVLDLQASSKSEAKAILVKIADSTRIAQQSATHLSQQQRQMAAPATPIVMGAPPPPTAPIQQQQQQQQQEEEEEEESNCVPKWGISIYSFQAEGGDELSVEENEQIYVLDYERTDGWWRVQKVDGDTGLVPSSYVQFDDDEEDDTPVGGAAAGGAAVAAVGTAAAAAAAHSRMDNVEEIRRKREEEERLLQQKRIAQEEERELQRRKDQEERARLEEEAKRRREEEKRREEEERERRKQVQEAAKRAEAARQKQIEEDYRRKEAERKATLARSASTSAAKNNNRHENLPKPDTSKIRTWTDRSGSFRVEAQFIDFHNGKLRLHKLNGVKIDVPVEKMCQEDVRWVENHTKNMANQQQEEVTPAMPARPAQQQQPSRPPQKKLNERWDWFDWFMIIGIPMQASLQYASAFKQDKLDDSDIPNLTHKQMKTLGLKEEHVRRVERYIETGEPEDTSEEGSKKPKEQSQMEKDEELARKLQREWESSEAGSKGKAASSNARPRPNVSAPKDIHPDLLDFIGTQLTSSDAATSKGKEPEKAQRDLVGFNDDAWAPRAGSSPVVTMSPMKATPAPAPAAPAAPAGPTPEQTKAAEAERKRIAEEEQIQKIQLMSLQRQAQEQQKQLEQLQQLTKQQLELQKQLAMQTGSQQQQHQQQVQMQQVQQQQQQLQQQLAQQPSQLQPSFAMQPQHTAMQSQQTPTGRARPTAGNRLNPDISLGQWQPNQAAQTGFQQQQQQQQQQPALTGFQQQQPAFTGFQQQAMQTGFQPQQQPQQASWQAQQLQPQMTGFPPGSQVIGQPSYNQPMATATVPLSSILPQPLQPSAAGQQQGGGLQRAQTIGVQATGRHWGAATPDNPFGSPTLSPLQAQMTGVQFSTPSPQAFHQSPLQSQATGYMQPQMTGFQQPSNSIFTPQGSMQYGQSAFPNNQKPW
ncbi:hypothetical protein MFLAVUS_011464 [Mucor flavus]|uniref:Actin cytoskeleton-regulatory complex protein SLA1 n=1 Tax=Mucor flavus TaxID=439312 RepID=A0ABP9ZFI9_9FUNG